MCPTFDQDLTNLLVKCYLNRGKSKVGQAEYPLTNIRLTISGQCYKHVSLLLCEINYTTPLMVEKTVALF